MSRAQVSFWIAAVGALLIGGPGFVLYLRDGSYFLDEASVVLSLQELSVLESLSGPLGGGGQNFPRFYLQLIRGVRWILGPETWSTRLLPHFFFLGATVLWMRLFWLRFSRRPLLVLLGVTLVGMSAPWLAYGAVIKQYSLDVFLALALFSVSDSLLDQVLGRRYRERERQRLWRLALFLLPVLLSYTYVVALLARVLGWVAFSWARGRRPDALSGSLFVGGLTLALALLWLSDVRHSIGREALISLWQTCIASHTSWHDLPELLRRFVASWYVGPTGFVVQPKLPAPGLWLLLAAMVLGIVRALRSPVVKGASQVETRWGSRSLGCVAALVGVVGTSYVVDYPICAGRLTLYVLYFQQLLMLEGLDWLITRSSSRKDASRLRLAGSYVLPLALAVLVVVSAKNGLTVERRTLARLPLENVRPLLHHIREEPELPVLVSPCMLRQVRTLPEGLDDLDVRMLPISRWAREVPRGRAVWMLHSRMIPQLCRPVAVKLRSMSTEFESRADELGTAVVYRAEVRTRKAQARARRKQYRASEASER